MNKFNIQDKVLSKSLNITGTIYSIQFFHSTGILYEIWEENSLDEYDVYESGLELVERYNDTNGLTQDKKNIFKSLIGSASNENIDMNMIRDECKNK